MNEQLLEQISKKINNIEVVMNDLRTNIQNNAERDIWWKNEAFLKWIYKMILGFGLIGIFGAIFFILLYSIPHLLAIS